MKEFLQRDLGSSLLSIAVLLGWIGINWEGEGLNTQGKRKDNEKIVIRIDENFFRPSEVDSLLGDPTKAKEKLGWTPKYTLKELAKEMIENDIQEIKKVMK